MSDYFPTVFDSSMLASFKDCPTKFKYTYMEEWKPTTLSVHLHAGKAFASGVEAARTAFYSHGETHEDAVAAGLERTILEYGDFETPEDSAKSLQRTAGALEYYFSVFPMHPDRDAPIRMPDGRLGIEFSFAEPLDVLHPITGEPIIYCGRLDALLGYAGGTFMCDEKTTTQLGQHWGDKWKLRSQFTGYAWGARRAGIKVDGAIVRGIAILKTQYNHAQAVVYRPEWQVDRWYGETLNWINQIIGCWKTDVWQHNLDDSCASYGGCQFIDACDSQDPHKWIEVKFTKRHWDPLKREELPVDPPVPVA